MIYGIYFAYSQTEVTGRHDPSRPLYPQEYGHAKFYRNYADQLMAYAETPCPASQTFEAGTMWEADKIVEKYKRNFQNEAWLAKNIYPYI